MMGLFGNRNQGAGRKQDPTMRMGIGIVIAGYLIYLGVDLLKAFAKGEMGIQPWMALLFGILFIAAGVIYGVLQFLAYRRARAEAASETEADVDDAEAVSETEEDVDDAEADADADGDGAGTDVND